MDTPDDFSPATAVYAVVASEAMDSRKVNVPYAELAARTMLAAYAIEVALDHLGMAGLVSAWDPGSGPCATLTPLAAARLGLRLVRRTGARGGLSWEPIGHRDRKQRSQKVRIAAATDQEIDLDQVAGDDAEPHAIVEAIEEVERIAPRPDRRISDEQALRLPWPQVLLTGCRSWPDGWPYTEGDDGRCPGCRDSPLPASTYCLVCDRWGLDFLVARIRRADAQADRLRAQGQARRCRSKLARA